MVEKTAPPISKSRYISGLQCAKLLWHQFNARELIPDYSADMQAIFDQGTEVGVRARDLYPGGILIGREEWDREGLVEDTRKALAAGKPLYEASFLGDGAYAEVDILAPARDGAWDIVEVKSSTRVKEPNVDDVALQCFAAQRAGIKVRRCVLAHINNQYVRKGEVDNRKLFTEEDITDEVAGRLPAVPDRLREMNALIGQAASPDVPIGPQCFAPYECPMIEVCWKDVPDENVTRLYKRSGGREYDLIRQGILAIKDIPEDYPLSGKQTIQVRAARSRKPHLDAKQVGQFLKVLKYPLSFLDFETIMPAVPLFDGTRPYQQILFQFSLHVRRKPGGELTHHSFLAEGREDPRPAFLKALRGLLEDAGSIVSYHAPFEKDRLAEAARDYPEHDAWIDRAIPRFVDLLTPFRNFHIYYPEQNGSASLKDVLPALTGKGYEDLQIAEGGAASQEFLRVTFKDAPAAEVARVRADLTAYCGRDTLGMVEILDVMEKLGK